MYFSVTPILMAITLIAFCSLLSVHETVGKAYKNGKFVGIYPIPPKTPDPINIETRKVHNTSNVQPLILQFDYKEMVKVVNNGTLEVIVDKRSRSRSSSTSVRGGIFTDEGYVFTLYNFYYYVTNKTNGAAANTINGKGPRMEMVLLYYNNRYGTFEVSLKHRDGILKIIISVYIVAESRNNPYFNKFAETMKKIQNPGSSVEVPLGYLLRLFEPTNNGLYICPGQFTDDSGETHECSTNHYLMDTDKNIYSLTEDELQQSLGLVLDCSGQPLNNPVLRSDVERPIIKGGEIYSYDMGQAKMP